MDNKRQEAIAAICRVGGIGLIIITPLVEGIIVPIWHPHPNDLVVTVPGWIAGILGVGLLLFGTALLRVHQKQHFISETQNKTPSLRKTKRILMSISLLLIGGFLFVFAHQFPENSWLNGLLSFLSAGLWLSGGDLIVVSVIEGLLSFKRSQDYRGQNLL